MSGAYDALRDIVDLSVVEHQSHASPRTRRLRYALDWARAMARRPTLNVYMHVDLARMEAAFPASTRPPYVVFIHGIELWRPISAAARTALERASLLLTNSQTTLRIAREHHPWLPEAAVVHLGLSGEPPPPGPWPRPPRVLFFGRLETTEREKGQDLMLDAWSAISEAHPDAELVFAGAGSDLPRLRARVEGERLSSVRFEGFVSESRKWELLRTSRLLAFPSTQEGFGLVAVEAAAVGTPVVALENTAVAEVLQFAGGAAFVPPTAPEALGEMCALLLRSQSDAIALGRAGREAVCRYYQAHHFRERLRAALADGLISGASAFADHKPGS
jgi:glycosyltransferase involved in cell wall biosynthesis